MLAVKGTRRPPLTPLSLSQRFETCETRCADRSIEGSPLAIKHKVYADIVGIASAPLDYESRLRPMYPGAFQNIHLMVMDPYDVALTKLKRDSDKDFQDVLQLAEKIPFDLDLFEKRYKEKLRDNTTGKPEDNDRTFYRWKEAIMEDRARKEK